MSQIQLQLTDRSVSPAWWKKLVEHFIKAGDQLEIRCWSEEAEQIRLASRYGIPAEEGCEVSVKGTVTVQFLAELAAEQPADQDPYHKMTQYFTIHTKNNQRDFWSAHYGTEIWIDGASTADTILFQQIIGPLRDCFSIGIEE